MTQTPPIRIVLADDHALVMEGLRSLIDRQPDMQVRAAVQNGDELLAICKATGMSISQVMLENEKAWRREDEVRPGCCASGR